MNLRPWFNRTNCKPFYVSTSIIRRHFRQQYINAVSTELGTEYDEFLIEAVRAFLSVIQLFGHNRMRFHEKYLPELVDIFSVLRTKACFHIPIGDWNNQIPSLGY